jgi:hypothetical protein
MKSEEAQAMNRLLKKLTALRATLNDDERALLDGFILARKAVDEVAAHVFDPGLAKTPAKVPAPDEVAAHVFDPGLAKTPAKVPAPDEVAAHAFDPGLAKTPAPHPRYIVVFDAQKEIYRIA